MQQAININNYSYHSNPLNMVCSGIGGGAIGCFLSSLGFLSFNLCFPGSAALGVLAIPIFSRIVHNHISHELNKTLYNSNLYTIDKQEDLEKCFPRAPIGSIFINIEKAEVDETSYEVIYKVDDHTQLKWALDRDSKYGKAIAKYDYKKDSSYTLQKTLLLEKQSHINNYFHKQCFNHSIKSLLLGGTAFIATAITVALLSFPPTTAFGIMAAAALVFIVGSAFYGIKSYHPVPQISTNRSSSFALESLHHEPGDDLMDRAEKEITAATAL